MRVDQLSRGAAADEGHVMDSHQKLGAEQRPVRGAKYQYFANHVAFLFGLFIPVLIRSLAC